jgi:hypothetical protein
MAATPRPTTTDQWNRVHGSRSILAGTRLLTGDSAIPNVTVTRPPKQSCDPTYGHSRHIYSEISHTADVPFTPDTAFSPTPAQLGREHRGARLTATAESAYGLTSSNWPVDEGGWLATIASGPVESISSPAAGPNNRSPVGSVAVLVDRFGPHEQGSGEPGSRRVAAGAESFQRPGDDPGTLPIDQCTLKDLRLRRGLIVAELVRRTAINVSTYRAQETGGTPLSPRVLKALTELRGVAAGQIEHAWARTRAQLFSRQRALAQKLSTASQAEG